MNINGEVNFLNQLQQRVICLDLLVESIRSKITDRQDNPLMKAISENLPNEVQTLIKNGSNVNNISDNGYTALAYAYKIIPTLIRDRHDKKFKNTNKCIQLLLQHGADPQIEPPGNRIIFGGTYDYRHFMRVKFAIAHVAMLRALDKPILTQTLWEIHSCDTSSNYFKMCTHLLQVQVCRSLTILKLLTDSDHKILMYARNSILLAKLKRIIYNKYESNSYYFNRIQQRFQEAIATNRCADFISFLFGGDYDSHYPIVNKIVNYLDEVDMKAFLYIDSTTK